MRGLEKINAKPVFKKRIKWGSVARNTQDKNGNVLSGKVLVNTWEITRQGITAKFDLSRANHIKSI